MLSSRDSLLRAPLRSEGKPPCYSATDNSYSTSSEPPSTISLFQRAILCFKRVEEIPDVNILMGSMLCPVLFIIFLMVIDTACPGSFCSGHNTTGINNHTDVKEHADDVDAVKPWFIGFLSLYAAVPCTYFSFKAIEKCIEKTRTPPVTDLDSDSDSRSSEGGCMAITPMEMPSHFI